MRRAARFLAASTGVAAAFALGFLLTQSERSSGSAASPPNADRPVRVVDEVRAELTASYYRWIDPAVLREPTVDAILAGLDDPHTDYLTPVEYKRLQETTEGTYSGIGLTVGPARNGLLVTSALRGPARDAGIREGDIIVRIDGEAARNLPFERSLALIKGEQGTIVRLTVRRPDKGKLEFTVVRSEIEVPPVSARLLTVKKRPVAYVRVYSFPAGAALRIERVTTRLVAKGAEAAILDLRDNPGGLLSEAVSVASIFLEDGVVCSTAGIHAEERTYSVSGSTAHPELPVVVLVNGGSASSAEIVAAALADNDRSPLVGDRTYGKASVQTVAPLADGGALKLTTAKYVTPAGADITGQGLRPPKLAVDDPLTERDEAMKIARRVALRLIRASAS